ncbi:MULTISPECIES: TonB-dependent receptor [unclassified Myroides]|uniref:TonB-dependent receptor n=1 Tax=unclassified Myroides TaxID=2642485 RepID=UPI003D2F707C
MQVQYFLWIVFVVFFGVASSYAQHAQDSITTLSEIVVQKDKAIDIIPPQRLAGEALQRLNQYNVADALRYFAGVKVKDYGGMGGMKTVDVRHMGTHHVGVLYNGIQLGNAQNGIVDLGKFALDNIEQIDLYNGQRSSTLQAAKEFASASLVSIQTKQPVFEAGKRVQGQVSYTLGTIQWVNPSAGVEVKVNDQVSTRISGAYLYSNGRYKFRQKRHNIDGSVAYDLTDYRRNSGIESYRIENNWFGKDEVNTWQATAYFYQSQRGLPSAIIKKSDITEETEKQNEQQGDKNVMLQGEWKRTVSPYYQFVLKGKFAYDQLHYKSRKTVDFDGDEVTYNPQFDNTYEQQEWYVSAAHSLSLKPYWMVDWATDIQYNKLNASRVGQESLFSFPERYTFYTALSTRVTIGPLKAQAAILGTFTKEKVRYNYQAPDRTIFTPSVFVSYHPWQEHQLELHAFYKHTYRLPSFNDLYYTQLGTAQLKPEYNRQLTIGLSHQQPIRSSKVKEVYVAVEGYYAKTSDKIIASPTSSMMRWMMSNLGEVEQYGIESQVKTTWQLWAEVRARAGLTYEYTRAKDWTVTPAGKPSYYGDQIPYAPWHSGSAIAGLDYRDWSLTYSFIYVGKRYNGNKNNNKRNELQPWYTHDVGVVRTIKGPKWQMKVSLEAHNLANQYYEVVTNFPLPGRNFRVTVNVAI